LNAKPSKLRVNSDGEREKKEEYDSFQPFTPNDYTDVSRQRNHRFRVEKSPPSLPYPRNSDAKQCYKNIHREFYLWERAFEDQDYIVRKRQLDGVYDVYTAYLERSLPDLTFLEALPHGGPKSWRQLVEFALHYPGSRDARFFKRHDEIMLDLAQRRCGVGKGIMWDMETDLASLVQHGEEVALPSLCPRTIGYMKEKLSRDVSDGDEVDEDESYEDEAEDGSEDLETAQTP